MTYTPLGVPFKLNAQDMGVPDFDLFDALSKGQNFAQRNQLFPQQLQQAKLQNIIDQVKANYAAPMAKQDLLKATQYNQAYLPDIQSQIRLRGYQSNNLGAETREKNYLMDHPGFRGGDETKTLESLRQMGLLDEHYQPIIKPNPMPTSQQPQHQGIIGGFTPIPGNKQAQYISNEIQQRPFIDKQDNQLNPRTPVNSSQGLDVSGLVHALINKPQIDAQYKQSLTNVIKQNIAGKAYNSMPTVEKEYAISQARAFGYTGEEASQLFNQNHTLPELAESRGYDPKDTSTWPVARGAPTTAIQTVIQRANSTMAALNAIEPIISKSYAEYSPRFKNVSPALIKDMISGENPEAQSDALSAYALYPEMQALRIKAQGGNIGERAIEHMANASYSRLETLGISPNSQVYKLTQKKINRLISKMNKAENSAIYSQQNQSYDDDDRYNNSMDNTDYSLDALDAEMSKRNLK